MADFGDNGFEEGVEDSGPMGDASFQQSFSSGNGGIDTKREQLDSRNRSRSRSPARNYDDNKRRDRSDRRDRERRRDRGQSRSQYASIIDQRTGKERRVNYEYCVFVSNIPYEVTWSELKTLMSEHVGPVAYVECFQDVDGKPAGCAFVEFKEKDSATKSVESMDKYDIRGRKLVVKPDFDGHHSSKFRRRKEQDMRAHALLTPQLLQSLSLDPDCLSDTVFVANLFYKMDWRDIKDVFRVAGNVERVEVFKDKDERSKGLAVVKFESVVDAVNAICMLNGRMLHNRELLVRMNREKNLNQREREPPKPKPVPIPRGLESMGPSLEQIAQGIHTGPGNMGGGRMGGNIGMGGGGSLGGGGIGGGAGGLGGGLGGFQGLGGGLGSGLGGGLGSGGLGGGLGGGLSSGGLGGPGSSSLGLGSSGAGLGLGGLGLGGGLGSLNPNMGNLGNLSGGLGSSSNLGNLGGLGSSDMGRSLGGGVGLDRLQSELSPRFSNLRDDLPRDIGQSRGSSSYGHRDNYPQEMGYRDRDMDRHGMGRDRGDRGGHGGHSSGHDRDHRDRSSGGGNLAGTPKEGGCQIFVRNLPFSVDWHQLKDAFKDIGHVMYADVKMDDQNRSKGYGTVRFERAEEAYRAISMMNGRSIKGRNLDVSLDRY